MCQPTSWHVSALAKLIFSFWRLTQLLALLANRKRLDLFWVCFIDNTAGLAALAKGFSKEGAVNNLLAFFWCLCAELGWFGHFEWVASKLNPADPVSRGDLQGGQSVRCRDPPRGSRWLLAAPSEGGYIDDVRYRRCGAGGPPA